MGDLPGMRPEPGLTEVVFIDSPDPDNFMMAAMAVKLRKCRHVVLSGRPANLGVESRTFSPKTCRRTLDEVDEPSHTEALQKDFAARLVYFFKEMGCAELPDVYDGGCAPHAPVTHAEHVHDFLFHRTDLAGAKRDRKFLTFDDYKMLKAELDAAGPERAPKALELLASSPYPKPPILPLSKLVDFLDRSEDTLRFLIGSPLTAARELLKRIAPQTRGRLQSVHAQAAAWNVKASNLFPNQFNVACDRAAADALLTGPAVADDERLTCPVYLVTTEVCKHALALEPETLQAALGGGAAGELYELWHAVTGCPPKLVVFDVGPMLTSWRDDVVPMVPIECEFDADDVLQLSVVEASNILAAPPLPPDKNAAELAHVTEVFVQALQQMRQMAPGEAKVPAAAGPTKSADTAPAPAPLSEGPAPSAAMDLEAAAPSS